MCTLLSVVGTIHNALINMSSFQGDPLTDNYSPPPHAGCSSDTTYSRPLDYNFYWPPTLKGDTAHLPCPIPSGDSRINVTRTCGEDGQWSEPDGLQECYNANINEGFDEILKLLNQVSLFNSVASLHA